MLGNSILEYLKDLPNYDISIINRTSSLNNSLIKEFICDLTNEKDLKFLLQNINPDIIIHCAAITDVNFCENNKDIAYKNHVTVTKNLAQEFPEAKFIYISTDSVYDGFKGNFSEIDNTSPQNYYAMTKLLGENEVLKFNSNSYILRTNIFGFHSKSGNSLFEWCLNNYTNKTKIFGYQNIYFNPLYTNELAKIIYTICDNVIEPSIYNLGSKEHISKYEFLNKIRKTINLPISFLIKKEYSELNIDAIRPKNTTLNIEKFENTFNLKLITIQNQINNCLRDYYENN